VDGDPGAVKANFWIGLAAASALIFGAAYSLWMFKRVYLGPVGNDHVKALSTSTRANSW
jgi:NADH-quinone oxidoreductase subunit M